MEWTPVLRRYASRVRLDGAEAEVLSWAHAPHLSDNVFHRHTYFEVCTVGCWGSGNFTINGRAHAIKSGDTFFARPGEEHRIQNTSPRLMELFWVAFALSPLKTPEPQGSLSQAFARSSVAVHPADKTTLAIWNALQTTAQDDAISCCLVLENLTRSLLFSILRSGSDQVQAQFRVQEGEEAQEASSVARLAVRYIHDNLARRLPVEEIAAHVHVSPRHLARLFRAFTGTSPADYIEAARIQRARHLLGHERASVKQTAWAVGYGDVQHFTRAFSRRVGTSPGAFRAGQPRVLEGAALDGDMV